MSKQVRDNSKPPTDYRPPAVRSNGGESLHEVHEVNIESDWGSHGDGVKFDRGLFERAINNKEEETEPSNPHDQIAELTRALTYGEMIDLAAAIWSKAPEGGITKDNLALVLHTWSKSAAGAKS